MNLNPVARQHSWFSFVLAAAILLVASQAVAGPIVFTVAIVPSGATQFGTADLATGNFAQIGNTDYGYGPNGFGGIGYGTDGNLYGLDGNNTLIRMDTASGAFTLVGNSGIPQLPTQPYNLFAGTAAGNLFAIGPLNVLYSVNQATGAATVIGPTGIPSPDYVSDTGYVSALQTIGNTLYFHFEFFNLDPTSGDPTTDVVANALYRLNPITGAATKISDLAPLDDIYAGIGNSLYGLRSDPTFSYVALLETFDPTTGTSTVTVNSPPDNYFLEAVATPEPGTMLLIGASLVAVGLMRQMRRAPRSSLVSLARYIEPGVAWAHLAHADRSDALA